MRMDETPFNRLRIWLHPVQARSRLVLGIAQTEKQPPSSQYADDGSLGEFKKEERQDAEKYRSDGSDYGGN